MHRTWTLLMLLAFTVSACGGAPALQPAPTTPGAAAALTDVNLCYSAPTSTQSLPWYALEKGYFEKYGLRVNLLRVQASAKAMTTLITGDTDICQAAGTSLINAAAAGQDVVMIATMYTTYPTVLVARPEIISAEDLKGKRVGTSVAGSASAFVTRLILEEMGLDPDKDVILVEVGEVGDRVAAYRANQIDAMITEAAYLRALREEGISELYDFSKSGIAYTHTSMVTTRRYVAEHRETVLRFMRAIVEASFAMKQDPEGAKAVLAEYMGLDPIENAADLAAAFDEVVAPLLQEVPYPNPDGLQTLLSGVTETNPAAAGLRPEDLIDLSLLQELEAAGFIDEMRSR